MHVDVAQRGVEHARRALVARAAQFRAVELEIELRADLLRSNVAEALKIEIDLRRDRGEGKITGDLRRE